VVGNLYEEVYIMLVICVKTGLTYARKVHREGEVFILTGILEREYKDLSDEAWYRKQKRTYSGDVTFRRPTNDEIYAAIKDGSLDPGSASVRGHLSKSQLRVALNYAESKEMKKITAIRMLKDSVDMEVEDAPEEKAEVVKAPEKEVEALKEKVEPMELAEEPEKAPEEPEKEAEKAPEAPEEEPKAEESVKEPEALEEAPEKEPEAPKEESAKKKDKGKKDKKK
jgi:hypothetical protein